MKKLRLQWLTYKYMGIILKKSVAFKLFWNNSLTLKTQSQTMDI